MDGWVFDVYLLSSSMEIICRKKQKEMDFNRSLMVYDAFKAHTIDEMKAVLSTNSTNLIMMHPGCNSKCQPLDVCINKPFKGV